MTQLILDAAYPPSDPRQWVATLRQAGATGCMAYIFDQQIPNNRWTPDYCRAIQAAGFSILPVYVWGPTYPAIGHARQVMQSYGWNSGPVMGDIEAGSWPTEAYYAAWCSDLSANGYVPVTYGLGSTLDTYGRYGQKRFLASYIQRTLQPIPSLNGVSYDGWQYADSFPINGVEVDASVTSIPLIGGGAPHGGEDLPLNPATDQAAFDAMVAANPLLAQLAARTVREENDFNALIYRVKAILDNAANVDGGPTKGEVNQLKAALDGLKTAGAAPHTHSVTGTAS